MGMDIPINNEQLFIVSFADDQVVLAQDAYDLEFMIKRLYNEYKKWGLQVSLQKTEYLVANSEVKFEVMINDVLQVKPMDQFKYRGAQINKDGLGTFEINNRIQQSRKIIGALNPLWWDKNISIKNKKRIGQTMVESVLSYGCEVWSMNADIKRKLTAVEMDYLRRSAGVSRIEIRNRMEANETIIERVQKRSLKWFGHLLRMPEDRLPNKIFQWQQLGKRKRGRPRRSWNEGIRQAMASRNLEEDQAWNREAWHAGIG